MNCPLCESTSIYHECCGSSTSTCRSCGFRWDSGISEPCPVPTKPLRRTELQMDDFAEQYHQLTDNELWGE